MRYLNILKKIQTLKLSILRSMKKRISTLNCFVVSKIDIEKFIKILYYNELIELEVIADIVNRWFILIFIFTKNISLSLLINVHKCEEFPIETNVNSFLIFCSFILGKYGCIPFHFSKNVYYLLRKYSNTHT